MIFTAIGAAVAGALFGGSLLAASVIAAGLAYGAQIGLSYLMAKKQQKRAYAAVQGEVQYGANTPDNTIFGTCKVKGHRIYYAKWGSGNKYNADVYVLANGWCDGLEPYVYFYGTKQMLVDRPKIGNEVAHFGVAGFDDLISIRFYDGRPGQGVDQKLVNDTVGLGRRWKPTSVCAGLTYVVFERKYDGDKFEKGAPDIDWVLRGLRLYDPRFDSTIAGGSGPQRLNDEATWVFSENPAVQRLNYQIGLRGRLSDRTLIGEGKSIGQLDLSSYIASMNYCDTMRLGKPVYRCSIYVTADDDHTEVLNQFDDAMAGFALNRRGLSGVIAGAPQVPILTITSDDIPADRGADIQYRKSAFSLYNMMSGQFTSLDAMYNPESLKPVLVNADIAADGRKRQIAYDFLQVTDSDRAQYLLNIRYRQQRLGGSVTLPVSRRVGLQVMEGEWLIYDNRTWMVSEWRCDEQFRITLGLTETSSDIYSDAGIDPGPIVPPAPPLINPSLLSTVQGFNIEVGTIKGADGFEQPALRFTWTPPEDPTITAVRFFYRVADENEIFEDQCTEPEAGVYITGKNVQSGRFYQGRATITTVPDRFKTFTPWMTTVTATSMQSVVIDLEQTRDSLKDVLKNIQRIHDTADDLLERLAAATAVGAGQNFNTSAVVVKTQNALAASFLEQKATITEIDGEVTAIAEAMLGVEAMVNNVSAGGLISFKAQVPPPAGVLSEIAIMARATVNDDFIQSGMVIQVYLENGVLKSRIVNLATQFVIWDGSARNLPFVYEDGTLKLKDIRLATLFFDQLQSTNGKFVMRGYGNFADMRLWS